MANTILNQFKQNPDAWTLVDKILDKAAYPHTKFFALQILDEAVNVSIFYHYELLIDSMENST